MSLSLHSTQASPMDRNAKPAIANLPPKIYRDIAAYLDRKELVFLSWILRTTKGALYHKTIRPAPLPDPIPEDSAALRARYMQYHEGASAVEKTWRKLVQGLCINLPDELLIKIVEAYIESFFPRTITTRAITVGAYDQRIVAPANTATFDGGVAAVAEMLFHKLNSEIQRMQSKYGMAFDAPKKAQVIIAEAITMIPKKSTYRMAANFPSRNSTSIQVPPPMLTPHVSKIKHLELITTMPSGGVTYYPVELYKAQDHISKLKSWFPQLKVLALTIVDEGYARRQYLVRGFSRAGTTFAGEVEKIVAEMRKLDIQEKGLRLLLKRRLYAFGRLDTLDHDASAWTGNVEPADLSLSDEQVVYKAVNNGGGLVGI